MTINDSIESSLDWLMVGWKQLRAAGLASRWFIPAMRKRSYWMMAGHFRLDLMRMLPGQATDDSVFYQHQLERPLDATS